MQMDGISLHKKAATDNTNIPPRKAGDSKRKTFCDVGMANIKAIVTF